MKIRTIAKYGNETAVKRNIWVTWAEISTDSNTPKIQPSISSETELKLKGTVQYRYNCLPSEMFDLTTDVPDFSGPYSVGVPGIHPWTGTALLGGAGIKFDASRQFRVVLQSNIPAVQTSMQQNYPSVLSYPVDPIEGNDDPSQIGETPPYLPQGSTGVMLDLDDPSLTLPYSLGSASPQATITESAQFTEFARAQIGSKWYKCSDYFLSELLFKAKRENGKWIDNSSSFTLGNGAFPPP